MIEFVKFNINEILTKIVGVKKEEIKVFENNDKLCINLDLKRVDENSKEILFTDYVRIIVDDFVQHNTNYELCYEDASNVDNIVMEYRLKKGDD